MDTRGHKQCLQWVRRLRTWPGRLIRDIRRKIAGNAALEAAFREALERAEKILTRQPGDKNKLYIIEPVIRHMKEDGLLERSHLAGPDGDGSMSSSVPQVTTCAS